MNVENAPLSNNCEFTLANYEFVFNLFLWLFFFYVLNKKKDLWKHFEIFRRKQLYPFNWKHSPIHRISNMGRSQ